jgi:hypothetical protein
MSEDKHPLFPWDLVSLAKHEYKLLGDNQGFYPYPFLQAVEQYVDKKFVFQLTIWEGLQKWREYVERHPEAAPSCRAPSSSTDERDSVEFFKNLILAAAFCGDEKFLQTLRETAAMNKAPDTNMHGVRAAITAFANLFRSKKRYPTKKEVKAEAIKILTQTGSLIPGPREWPRIFQKAGLAGLHNATKRLKPAELFDGCVYSNLPRSK